MQVWSLGQEDSLKKETATHSSILAWEILCPWGIAVGYSPRGGKESDKTRPLSSHTQNVPVACCVITNSDATSLFPSIEVASILNLVFIIPVFEYY